MIYWLPWDLKVISRWKITSLSKDDRIEILQKLDQGALKPEQAELLLRGKGESPMEN